MTPGYAIIPDPAGAGPFPATLAGLLAALAAGRDASAGSLAPVLVTVTRETGTRTTCTFRAGKAHWPAGCVFAPANTKRKGQRS